MAAPLPTADDVIAVVKTLIADLGPDAFRTNGRIQLYSGPRAIVGRALAHFTDNRRRSFKDAARLMTTPIDYTKVGHRLEKYENDQDIYTFFDEQYAPYGKLGFEPADKVMRFASQEFVRASYGYVATNVCGGGLDRIFFEVELPEIVANHKITAINEIPAPLVGDFHAIHPYEAFRLICISELLEAKRYANKSGLPDARDDYRERRTFFTLERRDSAKLLPHVSPHEKARIKLRKRQVLATYSLSSHALAIADASAPSIPSTVAAAGTSGFGL